MRGKNATSPLQRPHTYVLTAAPDYLDTALEEVRRVDPRVHQIMEPDSEIAIVESVLGLGAMHEGLQKNSPIFLRHIAPAQSRVILAGDEQDLGTIARETLELTAAALLNSSKSFSVQARVLTPPGEPRPYRAFVVKSSIVPLVQAETGAREAINDPQLVISVLLLPTVGFVGISPVEFNLSSWTGGARRFAREEGQLSRAEFKLLEALEHFGAALPANGTALDLGAAPGGWTRILRQNGLRVLAVDPAPVDPSLLSDEGVRVVRGRGQDWLERLKQAGGQFDVILCDAHMDAREAARLMVDAAPLMRLTSFAILNLALPSHEADGTDPVTLTQQALKHLRTRYRTVRARQLFHNRNEVMVFLQV